MTLTYILPTVRNEWKLCQFLHVVNYIPIIIHVSQKCLGGGRRGTLDPTGQLVDIDGCFEMQVLKKKKFKEFFFQYFMFSSCFLHLSRVMLFFFRNAI